MVLLIGVYCISPLQRALAATLAALVALVAEIWLFVKADIFHSTFVEKKEAKKRQKQLDNTVAKSLEYIETPNKKID